jgi:hypothetical protein
MYTSVYAGLNPLIFFANTSWRSACALPVLHFSRNLTTEYSETTARFNGNFDTDNQTYVP